MGFLIATLLFTTIGGIVCGLLYGFQIGLFIVLLPLFIGGFVALDWFSD